MQLHNYFDYLGNLYACPFGSRNPDCPVYLSGFNTFKEILSWFNDLPEETKDRLVDFHRECRMKREKRSFP